MQFCRAFQPSCGVKVVQRVGVYVPGTRMVVKSKMKMVCGTLIVVAVRNPVNRWLSGSFILISESDDFVENKEGNICEYNTDWLTLRVDFFKDIPRGKEDFSNTFIRYGDSNRLYSGSKKVKFSFQLAQVLPHFVSLFALA